MRTEKPKEPFSQPDKISLFLPQPMEQQPFTPEGLGTCLGTVLKLLPITYVNQLAEGSAKVSECARFAYAEKGERLGTLQPHATDFDVSIFLFGKRNFLPGLR